MPNFKGFIELTAEEESMYRLLRKLAFPEVAQAARGATLRHYYKNKSAYRASNQKFRTNNPDYSKTKVKEYRKLNPERYKAYDTKRRTQKTTYKRERMRSDINFRLAAQLRCRVSAVMRGANKSASTLKLLGCPIESFKLYLESKFEPGMSWENYGRGPNTWQIDHVMPCAIFDLAREDHQQRCFHFSNMQPMWTHLNQSKNCKVLL